MSHLHTLIVRTIGAILLLTLTGCAGESSEPVRDAPEPATDTAATEQAPAPPAAERSIDLPVLLDAGENRPPGVDTLAILDRLPDPVRITTQTRPNEHVPDATDTLRTYHYDDLTFTVVQAANGKELMESVTATGDQYATDDGLRVGMSRSSVEELLGEPSRVQEESAIYDLGEPTPTILRVAYADDQVEELTWHFYVD